MKKIVLTVFILFLLLSCNKTNKSDGTESHYNSFCEPDNSTITLSLAKSLNKPTQNFEKIVDTAYVVTLQTTENNESFVGFINEGIVTDNYIYLRDNYKLGSVIIFTSNGDFVKRIATGRGPGEVNRVTKIAFNQYNNTLLVCHQNTISQYMADGTFIISYDVPLLSDIVPLNDGYLIVQREWENPVKKNFVVKTDSNFVINDDCYIYENNMAVNGLGAFKYSFLYENEPRLFWPLTDVIYSYKNNKVVAKYQLDYPHVTGVKEYDEYNSKRCQGLYSFNNDYGETTNYIFLSLISDIEGKANHVYINKLNNKSYVVKTSSSFYIYNFGVYIGCCNNFFVRYISTDDTKRLEEIIDNSSQWLSEQSIEKIRQYSREDNPLLVFYKLKTEQND